MGVRSRIASGVRTAATVVQERLTTPIKSTREFLGQLTESFQRGTDGETMKLGGDLVEAYERSRKNVKEMLQTDGIELGSEAAGALAFDQLVNKIQIPFVRTAIATMIGFTIEGVGEHVADQAIKERPGHDHPVLTSLKRTFSPKRLFGSGLSCVVAMASTTAYDLLRKHDKIKEHDTFRRVVSNPLALVLTYNLAKTALKGGPLAPIAQDLRDKTREAPQVLANKLGQAVGKVQSAKTQSTSP